MGTRPADPRPPLERITPLDASNLRVEDRGVPMHVAALALLEGAPLLDAHGRLRLDDLRQHVEQRVRRSRRLRQVLRRPPRGLGPPFWLDDPAFDIKRQVRTSRVSDPGDESSLLARCCELNEPALDRGRPLWELWVLTGLADGRVALLLRLHHVLADGIAALSLLAPLFDAASDAQEATDQAGAEGPGWAEPDARALWADSVRRRRDAGRRAWQALARPSELATRTTVWARQVAALTREGRAPTLSLNQPVGARRRLALVRADLAAVKAASHRHGATVNDQVLAAVAGGALRLLESRGEVQPGLVLKVSVAASLRDPNDSRSGNRVGTRIVSVPVSEADAVSRLETIATTTAAQRARPPYQPGGRFLQRWMVHVMARQRLVNLLVSNMVGPGSPLFFAGSRVLEVFPIGVVQGNLAVAVGALSYAGQLNLVVVADADIVPDLAVFADGVGETLRQLGVPAGRR